MDYVTLFSGLKEKISMLLSDNVSFSYPMPDIENGIQIERFFLYSLSFNLKASRPFAILAASTETGEILQYQDCHLNDFFDGETHPFSQKISYELPQEFSMEEYEDKNNFILQTYEVVRQVAFKDCITQQEKDAVDQYWTALEQFVPASLLPFYQAIGKSFFKWSNSLPQ